MSKSISNLKISVSGVRGVVGETLTPRLISTFAAAYGQYVGRGPVIVGRDTRQSGIMVEQAVIAGLLSVGCQPVSAGILPTPSIQVIVKNFNAVGAIAVTASHNPLPWNALKFINEKGMFLNEIEARQVLDIYNQENINYVLENQIRQVKKIDNAFAVHQQKIFENVDCEKIRKRKFKVAIDCVNGAGAPYTPPFLEDLGCEVVPLFSEPDGNFKRMPEPTPDALTALSETVTREKCDIGFAQDPDADRLVLVDEKGIAQNENCTLALAVSHILSKTPGNVTVNLATSKVIQDICDFHNCNLTYTKIGEINVSTEMLKNGSVIGGEANGGVIWPTVHPCRDSFTGIALILEYLSSRTKKVSEVLSELSQYHFGARKIHCSSEKALYVMRHLKDASKDLNPILNDGIRINWDNQWIIIRPSNTEPVLRIHAEAGTKKKLDDLLNSYEQRCRDLMG